MSDSHLYEHLRHRGVISLGGFDAQSFLQSLLTNDIRQLHHHPCLYSCLLTPQGKFLYDFFVMRHEDEIWLDCSAANIKDIMKRLTVYSINTKVQIHNVSQKYAVFWLSEVAEKAPPPLGISYQDPRNPAMGGRAVLEHSHALDWLKTHLSYHSETGGYDRRRYALGIPEGDRDMLPEKHFPHDFGLEHIGAIDYKKGCYVGQEVTTRTKHRGKVRKKPYKVTANAPLPPYGTAITLGGKVVGILCSSEGLEGLAVIRDEKLEELKVHNKGELKVKNIPIHVECPEWYKV